MAGRSAYEKFRRRTLKAFNFDTAQLGCKDMDTHRANAELFTYKVFELRKTQIMICWKRLPMNAFVEVKTMLTGLRLPCFDVVTLYKQHESSESFDVPGTGM